MLRRVLFLLAGMFSESAFPIGRIGNQTLNDNVDHYSANIPAAFASVSAVDDGGLVLASGRFGSVPMMPVDIQVLPFKSQYPALAGQGLEPIRSFFFQSPGIHYDRVDVKNSALSLFGETSTSYVGVSVCGDGRGYVLFGPRFELTKSGILEILMQTKFDQPCLK